MPTKLLVDAKGKIERRKDVYGDTLNHGGCRVGLSH